ncbi:hypothetical protein ACWCOW_35340 [Streptomyces sp. NPDC001939]
MIEEIDEYVLAARSLGHWATADTLAEMKATLAAASRPSGGCRHLARVEVRSAATDEVLAHLCPDCDAQLPA